MASTHAYLEPVVPGRPLAFAHRGGAAVGDENTLAAFGRAVALGYRHLETDVRATSDGVAVIFHDATTERMLGERARLADLTWQDLSTLRNAGAIVVPRLDELLDTWPDAFVNIDVKTPASVAPTLTAIGRADAFDRVLVASFHDDSLAVARRLGGDRLATSLGRNACVRLGVAAMLGRGGRGATAGAVAAQVPWRATGRRLINRAHALGLAVHAWTVNDAATMRGLLDAGADGIMTDHLDVLRDVYAERGIWPA